MTTTRAPSERRFLCNCDDRLRVRRVGTALWRARRCRRRHAGPDQGHGRIRGRRRRAGHWADRRDDFVSRPDEGGRGRGAAHDHRAADQARDGAPVSGGAAGSSGHGGHDPQSLRQCAGPGQCGHAVRYPRHAGAGYAEHQARRGDGSDGAFPRHQYLQRHPAAHRRHCATCGGGLGASCRHPAQYTLRDHLRDGGGRYRGQELSALFAVSPRRRIQ